MQSNQLQNEARIAKAIERMRAMGYRFHIESPNKDEMLLVLEIHSIAQRIESQIKYPKKRVKQDGEYLLIHFWRGENPQFEL